MAEAGVLAEPRRVELIDGDIIDMPAIGSPRAAAANRLARLFCRASPDAVALVGVRSPLRLDASNEPEPDLALLRPRADFYRASHPGAADIRLLVEVSESSLAYHRGTMLALRSRARGKRLCVARAARRRTARPGARPGRGHRSRIAIRLKDAAGGKRQ
jgi:Putative restriction endonuclease